MSQFSYYTNRVHYFFISNYQSFTVIFINLYLIIKFYDHESFFINLFHI